ncbi:MAG: hypothetical protein IJK84_10630 [Bacteroidales bacterium]|nr:hypothetical protein [Bacteroidales bacterium]
MKTRYILPLITAMICATACNKIDHIDPLVADQPCMVVYTIDSQEERTTVKGESEWEQLIDQFCEYAFDGKSVTFYNLSSQPTQLNPTKSQSAANEPTTITTTNREEIKAWMRKMEQAGRTVNVTYDRQTGTWSGRAYANAPIAHDTEEEEIYHGVITSVSLSELSSISLPLSVVALRINEDTTLLIVRDNYLIEAETGLEGLAIGDTADLAGTLQTIEGIADHPILVLDISTNHSNTIVGTWQYTCMTEYTLSNTGNYLNITMQYFPVEYGGTIYYGFASDGTATRYVGSPSSPTATGTWSLSDYDQLCCDLQEMDGHCWNIAWLTSSTLIITRSTTDSQNQPVVYQMQFESISDR